MQDIVKERLPSFTPEQSKLVKGSADYFGINQYTATYLADQPTTQQVPTSYSSDWHVQYICELPTYDPGFMNVYQHDYSIYFTYYLPLYICSSAEWHTNRKAGMYSCFLSSCNFKLWCYKNDECKTNMRIYGVVSLCTGKFQLALYRPNGHVWMCKLHKGEVQ
jgi:hypothetical protein